MKLTLVFFYYLFCYNLQEMNRTKSPHKKMFLVFISCLIVGLLFPVHARAASQIRITEIMYDPSGNGDKEFVEFYNGSDTTVSLGGWSTFGVDFIFPSSTTLSPGTYTTIARNSSALRASHPSARIAGQYSGKLRGSGELIRLMNAGGQTVSQVSYSYGGVWPSAPRNGGPSLSIIRPTANESSFACWAPSASLGGSPGVANSVQGGFGSGCGDIAYPISSTPKPGVSSVAQSTAVQSQVKAAEEAKKQEAAKKAAEQKAVEQKQEEIKAAEAKAVQQATIAEAANKANNQKKWVILSTIITLLLVSGVGAFIVIKTLRKKNVAQILSKKGGAKKHPKTQHAKA